MKTKVLFASSLKPARDTRTEKLSLSFGDYDCYFCGVDNGDELSQSNTWEYSRSLTHRFKILIKFVRFVKEIKPDVVIVNSLEFVPVLKSLKVKQGFKLLYDMQEDYVKNITHHSGFRGLKRTIALAQAKRMTAKLIGIVDGVIYAENCYDQKLKSPSIVMENKSIIVHKRQKELSNPIRLVFTGTLTKECGVYKALDWLTELNKIGQFELTMIGHTPLEEDHERLKQISMTNFHYKGCLTPLPHQKLVKEMLNSDFGLICYEVSPAKKSKKPTKLFEYMSVCLPVLCQNDGFWSEKVLEKKAGLVMNNGLILDSFKNVFYPEEVKRVNWETEKLTNWLSEVL